MTQCKKLMTDLVEAASLVFAYDEIERNSNLIFEKEKYFLKLSLFVWDEKGKQKIIPDPEKACKCLVSINNDDITL